MSGGGTEAEICVGALGARPVAPLGPAQGSPGGKKGSNGRVLCSAIGRVALRSAAANSELRGVRRQERANKMPEILINSLCL